MQRLKQRSPDAILLLFFIAQIVDITIPIFTLLALVACSVNPALIAPGLLQGNSGWRRMAVISAVITLICHTIALEAYILPGNDSGQNLSLLNVGSLIGLMICTVVIIVASRNRGWLLLPIVCAFALINLVLATFMPGEHTTHLEATPGTPMRIGLSLFSYTILIIAVLHVLQLVWTDYQLENKKLVFSQKMSPLTSIKCKMLHIAQIGMVLLALTLCTGLLYIHNLLSMENIDKAVLSTVAWLVYIVLSWGHYHKGWHGHRVV